MTTIIIKIISNGQFIYITSGLVFCIIWGFIIIIIIIIINNIILGLRSNNGSSVYIVPSLPNNNT